MGLRITGLLLLASTLCLHAQKQSSYWINAYYGFNFNSYPPIQISNRGSSIYQMNRASVADSVGNLLFYMDGIFYFDRFDKVMPNGSGTNVVWGTTALPFIIAPVPNSATKYYVFTGRLPKTNQVGDYDASVRYSIVDMSLNNGKGDVVQRNTLILADARDEFTLIKAADDTQGYWLVVIPLFYSTPGPPIKTYRVSSSGISAAPVITELGEFIDQTYEIKASPDGRYLVLRTTSLDGMHHLKVLKFNSQTGGFSLFREITTFGPADRNLYPQTNIYLGDFEFSADSRYLYVTQDSVYSYSTDYIRYKSYMTLLNYDLSALNASLFEASREVMYKFGEKDFPGGAILQLTPQRKIILSDVTGSGYFHTIHNPEGCTTASRNFERNSIVVGNNYSGYPPTFPPWYFYKPAANQNFGGADTTLCPNQTVTIGRSAIPGYSYKWEPVAGLSSLTSATPIFQTYSNFSDHTDTTVLYLTVTDTYGCKSYDSTRVIIKPINQWKIQGSKSVCPGVKEVKYWVENNWHGKKLEWSVSGGTISKQVSADTVLVDWGSSNPGATVTIDSKNVNECEDSVSPFPVKVFKFLETETPNGRDTLLCNQFLETYKILGTNGSVYDWQTINGNIDTGQGTNKVDIRWDKTSLYGYVWINESVNTDLETCFGRSDTLKIINPQRMLGQNILLKTISVSSCCNDQLVIYYKIDQDKFYNPSVRFLRKDLNGNGWETIGAVERADSIWTFSNQPLNEKTMEYRLLAHNICGDTASSIIHRNILLKSEAFIADNYISLSWNSYSSWPSGVDEYILQKSYDSLLAQGTESILANNFSYHYEKITDSFLFSFRTVAIPNDPVAFPLSYSNTIHLKFENDLFIPNVITPNGDGKNDTWKPFPLNLYSQNELIITNRWGQPVYEKRNYSGDWDGDDLTAGTYFYEFRTAQKNGFYRGFIQIIR